MNSLKPYLPKHPAFWLIAFVIWFCTLWYLSSGVRDMPLGPQIPFMDKIIHFGYFFGGAGLLSAGLFLCWKKRTPWLLLLTIVIIAISATGALDEWHQSWVPGRKGNDLGDWLADTLGGAVGAFVFKRVHSLFLDEKTLTS